MHARIASVADEAIRASSDDRYLAVLRSLAGATATVAGGARCIAIGQPVLALSRAVTSSLSAIPLEIKHADFAISSRAWRPEERIQPLIHRPAPRTRWGRDVASQDRRSQSAMGASPVYG